MNILVNGQALPIPFTIQGNVGVNHIMIGDTRALGMGYVPIVAENNQVSFGAIAEASFAYVDVTFVYEDDYTETLRCIRFPWYDWEVEGNPSTMYYAWMWMYNVIWTTSETPADGDTVYVDGVDYPEATDYALSGYTDPLANAGGPFVKTINTLTPTEDGQFFIEGGECDSIYVSGGTDTVVAGDTVKKGGTLHLVDLCPACDKCETIYRLEREIEYMKIWLNLLKDNVLYTDAIAKGRATFLEGKRIALDAACEDPAYTEDPIVKRGLQLMQQYFTLVHMWNYVVKEHNATTEIVTAPEDTAGFVVQTRRSLPSCGSSERIVCTIFVGDPVAYLDQSYIEFYGVYITEPTTAEQATLGSKWYKADTKVMYQCSWRITTEAGYVYDVDGYTMNGHWKWNKVSGAGPSTIYTLFSETGADEPLARVGDSTYENDGIFAVMRDRNDDIASRIKIWREISTNANTLYKADKPDNTILVYKYQSNSSIPWLETTSSGGYDVFTRDPDLDNTWTSSGVTMRTYGWSGRSSLWTWSATPAQGDAVYSDNKCEHEVSGQTAYAILYPLMDRMKWAESVTNYTEKISIYTPNTHLAQFKPFSNNSTASNIENATVNVEAYQAPYNCNKKYRIGPFSAYYDGTYEVDLKVLPFINTIMYDKDGNIINVHDFQVSITGTTIPGSTVTANVYKLGATSRTTVLANPTKDDYIRAKSYPSVSSSIRCRWTVRVVWRVYPTNASGTSPYPYDNDDYIVSDDTYYFTCNGMRAYAGDAVLMDSTLPTES